MKYLDKMKRTMSFLTAAMTVSMLMAGCSNNTADSDANSESAVPSLVEEATEDKTAEETTEEATEEKEETTETSEFLTAEPVVNKEQKTSESDLFSNRDLNPEYSEITAEIILNGDSVKIDGTGAETDGSVITINQEGVYYITGTLNDGQIVINADKAKVQLVLENVDITSSTSAPIYGIDSDKIFITLADKSVNTLTDASSYVYEEDASDEPDACIFSKDSITVNGSGTLNINANYNDGIKSKDDVVITGGTINVASAGDGITGKDYVAVADGNINIESGADGIKSTNTEDETLGFVYIEGGTFVINSESDGIQAETDLIITDGEFDITAGGGSENSAKTHMDDFGGMGGGGRGGMGGDFGGDFGGFGGNFGGDFGGFGGDFGGFGDDFGGWDDFGGDNDYDSGFTNLAFVQTENTVSDETSTSQKGLKGGASIKISGGNFNINSADDTLHSNGNLYISGGEIALEAGDDGIHADSAIEISGGTVSVAKSYEGIEAASINISDGVVEVNSSDDGFNASDGTSQGAMGTYSNGVELNISGGTVYVNASGDGLDSNGDMSISGGTIIVDGPINDGNGALDSNNSIVVTGGLLVAAGSSGMAEYPDSDSTQNSVSATFDTSYEGGTMVTLLNENGEEIVSFTPSKTFNNIVISSPDIQTGKTYTFYTGGSSSAESKYGLYVNGGYKNDGTESGSFTVNDITSFIGTQSRMGGGGMGGFGGGMGGGRGGNRGGDMTPPDMGDMPEPPAFN